MDLSALIPTTDELVVELEYKGETLVKKDGDPCTITLFAPHSRPFREFVYHKVDESIKAGKEDKEVTATDFFDEQLNDLVSITKTWDVELSGEPLEFTKANAKDIYDKSPIIVKQLQEALDKDGGFTQNLSVT